MKSKELTREERVKIVNEVMKEIASRGRNFFENKGTIAQLIDKGKIYYQSEYDSKKIICLSVPYYARLKDFFHGGTLRALVMEFKDYIRTGNTSSYSGLYSPHWGYPEEDMLAIQNKAKELGFINDIKK